MKLGKLLKSNDFLLVSKKGKSKAAAGFILAWYKNPENISEIRVGYTVSRKVGNAVERNRVKRRLRQVVAASLSSATAISSAHDLVIIGRRAAIKIPFENMLKDMKKLLTMLEK